MANTIIISGVEYHGLRAGKGGYATARNAVAAGRKAHPDSGIVTIQLPTGYFWRLENPPAPTLNDSAPSDPSEGFRRIVALIQSATPTQREIGLNWYPQFRLDIIRTAIAAGLADNVACRDIRQLAGIVAAFSPSRTPNINLKHLFDYVYNRTRGLVREGCYHSRQQDRKADAIWNCVDPVIALQGPKELAFFRAIVGDVTSLTIDAHAWNLWVGEYRPTSRTKVPPEGPRRKQCQRDYEDASRFLHLSHQQIQAIAWVVWRDRHQDQRQKQRRSLGGDFATYP